MEENKLPESEVLATYKIRKNPELTLEEVNLLIRRLNFVFQETKDRKLDDEEKALWVKVG